MEVELEFVPPGGGPVEYSLIIDFPALPRAGDQLSIRRPPDQTDLFAGTIDFIVRSVRWELEYPDNEIYEDPTDPNVGQTEIDHCRVRVCARSVLKRRAQSRVPSFFKQTES